MNYFTTPPPLAKPLDNSERKIALSFCKNFYKFAVKVSETYKVAATPVIYMKYLVPPEYLLQILEFGERDFSRYPNLIELPFIFYNISNPFEFSDKYLSAPKIIIVGDQHGTFETLFTILGDEPPSYDIKYVFTGDYVDRGAFSCEVFYSLLCFKIAFPQNFYMLRGNHETECMAWKFSLLYELYVKYTDFQQCDASLVYLIFKYFVKTFKSMPLAVQIGDFCLCLHGGVPSYEFGCEEDYKTVKSLRSQITNKHHYNNSGRKTSGRSSHSSGKHYSINSSLLDAYAEILASTQEGKYPISDAPMLFANKTEYYPLETDYHIPYPKYQVLDQAQYDCELASTDDERKLETINTIPGNIYWLKSNSVSLSYATNLFSPVDHLSNATICQYYTPFTVKDINKINRFRDPLYNYYEFRQNDPLNDILWADVGNYYPPFVFNDSRQTSNFYNENAVRAFLNNKIKYLIRSHTCVNGLEINNSVITVFSVPFYSGLNCGAYIVLNAQSCISRRFVNTYHAAIVYYPTCRSFSSFDEFAELVQEEKNCCLNGSKFDYSDYFIRCFLNKEIDCRILPIPVQEIVTDTEFYYIPPQLYAKLQDVFNALTCKIVLKGCPSIYILGLFDRSLWSKMVYSIYEYKTFEELDIQLPSYLFWPVLTSLEVKEIFFELSGDITNLAKEMNIFLIDESMDLSLEGYTEMTSYQDSNVSISNSVINANFKNLSFQIESRTSKLMDVENSFHEGVLSNKQVLPKPGLSRISYD